MAQCASCGNLLRDEAKFCAKCGTKFDRFGVTMPAWSRTTASHQALREPELCPGCGRTLVPEMQSCWACGRALAGDYALAVPLQPPPIPALSEDPSARRRRLVVLRLAAVPIALLWSR